MYLIHYNHNHDKLGRFAKSPGGGSSRSSIFSKKSKVDKGRKDSKNQNKQKSVSEMSTAELREATARMQAESDYYTAQSRLASVKPQHVSAGKKFVDRVVAPAVENAVKTTLTQVAQKSGEAFVKAMFPQAPKSELERLRDESQIATYRRNIAEENDKLKKIKQGPSKDEQYMKELEIASKSSTYAKNAKKNYYDMMDMTAEHKKKNATTDTAPKEEKVEYYDPYEEEEKKRKQTSSNYSIVRYG